MAFFMHMMRGVASSLSVASSPLYRYPYRDANEAFRGDWKRISGDIRRTLTRAQAESMTAGISADLAADAQETEGYHGG